MKTSIKKIVSGITTIVLSLSMMNISAFAETTSDGFNYTVSNDEVTITGYSGSGGDITIPAEIDGKKVVEIGTESFKENNKITSLTVSEGIEKIGYCAFMNCSELTSVKLPSTINEFKTIRVVLDTNKAFSGCEKLKEVTLAQGISEIGTSAFENCKSLESITIPKSVVSWGVYSFDGCTKLENVVLEDGLTIMGPVAFRGTAIKSITIPSTITNYPDEPRPNGMTYNNGAFANCTKLESVILSEGLASLGRQMFTNCTSLKEIVIPKSIKELPMTFKNATSLEKVTFEDGSQIETIGQNCFENCTKLKEIKIPNSVSLIDYSAFSKCESLSDITFPENLESIQSTAFSKCTSIVNISLPKKLNFVNAAVFSECSSLRNVYIFSKDISYIGNGSLPGGIFVYMFKESNTYLNVMKISGIIPKNIQEHPDHKYQETITKEATCTENGEKTFTCSLCEKTYTEPIIATGHIESDWIIDKEANYGVDGEKHIECTKCNVVLKTQTIPALEINLTEDMFTVSTSNLTYKGTAWTRAIKSNLVLGTDYTVAYKNNTNIGTATITITGIGKYTGTVTKTFKIVPKKLASSQFSLSTTKYGYTGTAKKPAVKSKLKLNKDYTVTYSSNLYVGTAKVTIKGKGNYTGTITKYFSIVKPTAPGAEKVTKLVAGKKTVTVTYAKKTGVKYKVLICSNRSFKGARKVLTTKTSVKFTKLASGKKYYVKVCAYKTYKTSKTKAGYVYGKYSALKAVRAK